MKRYIVMAFVGLLVVVALLGILVKQRADKRFYDGYSREVPLNATVGTPTFVQGEREVFGQRIPTRYKKYNVTFDGQPGEPVPTLITFPLEARADDLLPVIIFIHGSHQEKEFLEKICTPFNEAGFAMACFDQYMRGNRKVPGGIVSTSLAFRERCRKTVHETWRLIDYLSTRPDIDARRIYLVGASYGAITGVVATAYDKRIRAATLVVGGGNWRLLAEAPEVRNSIPVWIHPFVGLLMTFLAGVADPIHHASHTAGRPILMLNGSNDSVVTPESGNALYAALGEPKEIRWYPVDHPDREANGAEVLRMLDDGLKWLVEQDTPFRSTSSQAS